MLFEQDGADQSGDGVPDLLQGHGIQVVTFVAPVPGDGDQAGTLQNPHMCADSVSGHLGVLIAQLPRGHAGLESQCVEHGASGRVGDRLEDCVVIPVHASHIM